MGMVTKKWLQEMSIKMLAFLPLPFQYILRYVDTTMPVRSSW